MAAHGEQPSSEIFEDVAVLKRQMQDLWGNGRDGRVTTLEKSQGQMKLWIIAGVIMSTLGSAVGSHAMEIIRAIVK